MVHAFHRLCAPWAMTRWAMTTVVSVTTLVAIASTVPAVASAHEGEHPDTDVEISLSAGFIPSPLHGSVTGLNATGPFASGGDSIGATALGISGHATVLTPYYGAGIMRMMLIGGVTGYLGRSGSSTFGQLHPGTSADTGMSVSRALAFDLAIGGAFPLCHELSCMELRMFLGMSVVAQKATGFSDESTDGGVREEASQSGLKWGPLFGALLSKPLCRECSHGSLRLQLGALARSVVSTPFGFTSKTGRTYAMSVDAGVEVDLFAGLALPL